MKCSIFIATREVKHIVIKQVSYLVIHCFLLNTFLNSLQYIKETHDYNIMPHNK